MEEQIENPEENLKSVGGCGQEPAKPGSEDPGNWSCRNGQWVWIINVGG